jgi:hypothetical protein
MFCRECGSAGCVVHGNSSGCGANVVRQAVYSPCSHATLQDSMRWCWNMLQFVLVPLSIASGIQIGACLESRTRAQLMLLPCAFLPL